MASGSVIRGLSSSKRRKQWIILLGLIGSSGYGMYKLYHMPSVSRKRKSIMKLFESLFSIAEMVSDSSETITLVSRDLKEFLKSDSDEIPNSLKQLWKLTRSEEFSQSIIRVSQAMTVGVLRGYMRESSSSEIQEVGCPSFSDRVMDKMMSSAGTGFVSVIGGSFARNLVMGFYAKDGSSEGLSENVPRWLDLISDAKCRVLVADCINTFVSTAVTVYLDKTMNVNVYDEMFSGLTNPKHQNKLADILVSLCNTAVETLVKTSHQVLTSSQQSPKSDDHCSIIDLSEASNLKNKKDFEMNGMIDLQSSGWVNSVSSTLAVPSNRKFVLDLTGRVTFETVKSVIEFLFWKISEGLRKSMNMVHDEVLERRFEVVRYVGAKSYVIFTVCLALFLHILGNTRVLIPA